MVQILMPILRNHSFKLGRGLDQEVRISDISVSRYHAKIKFMEDIIERKQEFGDEDKLIILI